MTVKLNHAEILRMLGPTGPASTYLRKLGQATLMEAKKRAHRSTSGSHGNPPGYMAENIKYGEGVDGRGFYTEVTSTARTPQGFPYGTIEERQYPYLVPALQAATGQLRRSGLVARARFNRTRKRKARTQRRKRTGG